MTQPHYTPEQLQALEAVAQNLGLSWGKIGKAVLALGPAAFDLAKKWLADGWSAALVEEAFERFSPVILTFLKDLFLGSSEGGGAGGDSWLEQFTAPASASVPAPQSALGDNLIRLVLRRYVTDSIYPRLQPWLERLGIQLTAEQLTEALLKLLRG